MFCNMNELNHHQVHKCEAYFPLDVDQSLTYGDISIKLVSERNGGDFSFTRIFQVKNEKTQATHSVTHINVSLAPLKVGYCVGGPQCAQG